MRSGDLSDKGMTRTSLALSNLRAIVIIIVVAFHSASAYLGSLPKSAYPFDKAPYLWSAFPIVDNYRWFGFDLLCAWQDVYLMCLMFFLSALFTWPSLERKGTSGFLGERILRLGAPFLFGVMVVMPIALYPVYRVTASDVSVAAYVHHFLALPFWPNGPMWFLWQLLALTLVAAAVHRFAPGTILRLARLSSHADTRPGEYFLWLTVVCIAAYVPLALVFTPFAWINSGPFSLQLCRPLIYAVAYFAGLGVGARGIEKGLLAADGKLVQRWRSWVGGAFLTYALWIALTALALRNGSVAPFWLQVLEGVCFALACTAGWFAALALCLRFGATRSRLLDGLARNAFAVYVLHYPFDVWLQYALLGVSLFAIAKGAIVFVGCLVLTMATIGILRLVPFGLLLVGGESSISRRMAREQRAVREVERDPQGIRLSHIVR